MFILRRVLLISYSLLFITNFVFGQTLKWETWNVGYEKAKTENKILLVDVITTKCPYCVKMENETYKDPNIINQINTDFIIVKVNPKLPDVYYKVENETFNGVQLMNYFTKNSQYMEENQMVFPTTVFIMPKYNEILIEQGYQPPDVFKYMLFNCVKFKQRLDKKSKS